MTELQIILSALWLTHHDTDTVDEPRKALDAIYQAGLTAIGEDIEKIKQVEGSTIAKHYVNRTKGQQRKAWHDWCYGEETV